MILQTLVNEATAEALAAAYHSAREAALKAAAVGEAERLRLQAGGAVRELTSDQGLGSLRLDAANKPAVPMVDDPVSLGEWLAQRPEAEARALTHAEITVPVERLEEALEVLRFAGFAPAESVAATVVADQKGALAWLTEHCKLRADPGRPSGWYVVHEEEGRREVVPGAIGVKPVPRWVLKANDDHRKAHIATAQAEVDGLVAELRGQTAVALHIRDGVPPVTPWQTHSGDDDFPPEDDPAGRVRAEAEATVAERLEARMAAGDPVAAATHAIVVQGGYSTPEIEAERMAADRRVEARILAAGTTRAELDEDLADAAAEDGM